GSSDRQGDQHDVEPDPEESGRAGVGRRGPERARHEDRRRVDRGSASQPDAGDGRRAAVLQPAAQDLDGLSSSGVTIPGMRSLAAAAAVVALLVVGAVASAEPGPRAPWGRRSVSLGSATALQRLVKLHVRARGARRWIAYVDGKPSGFSSEAVGFARVTQPGTHRIFVALAGRDNLALG